MSTNKEGSNVFSRREILFMLGATTLVAGCKVTGLDKITEVLPTSTATNIPPNNVTKDAPPPTATDLPPATNVPETPTSTIEVETIHQPRWTVEQVEAIGPGHVKYFETNEDGEYNELMISAGAYGPLQLTDEFHPACYDNQPFQCSALVASTIESIGTETGRASFMLKTPDGGVLVPASEKGDTWKNEPIINDYLSEVIPPGLLQTHDGKQMDIVQLFDIGIDQENQITDGRFDRVALVDDGVIVAVHHVGVQMDGYTQLQVAEPGIMFGEDSPLAQTDPDQNLELIVSVVDGTFTAAYYPYRLNSELPGLINTDASATDGFGNAGHWRPDSPGGEFVWQAGEAPATATPEATVVVVQAMEEARINNETTITLNDPDGVEVIIDVVPQEVAEQGEWDWQLRGFTKQTDRGLEVWRTVYGPTDNEGGYENKSNWHVIIDSMDLSSEGLGILTIETKDPEQLAKQNGDKTPLSNLQFNPDSRQQWINGMQHLWKDKTTWTHLEVKDYRELQKETLLSLGIPDNRPETPKEKISKKAGISILVSYEFDESYAIHFGSHRHNVPEVAFKTDSQGGRTVLTIFTGNIIKVDGDGNLLDLTTAYMSTYGSAWLQWLSRPTTEAILDRMLIDSNPVLEAGIPIREAGITNAWEAFGLSPFDLATTTLLFQADQS